MDLQDDSTCTKSYYQLMTPTEASKQNNKPVDSSANQNAWYQLPENFQDSCQIPPFTTCADMQSCDQDQLFSYTHPGFFNNYLYNETGSTSTSPCSTTSSDMFFTENYTHSLEYMYDTVPTRLSSCSSTNSTTPDLNDLLSHSPVSECTSATDLVDSVDPYPREMIDCKTKTEEYGVNVQGHWYSFDPKSLREDDPLVVDLPRQEVKPWNVKPYYKENKKGQRSEKLWEFIRSLLLNPKFNPSLAEWVDRNNGLFRFNQSKAVAQLWGNRKNNTNMTYEKLSRAMRYYYSRKILLPVIGKKLVYKFGPNSYGW